MACTIWAVECTYSTTNFKPYTTSCLFTETPPHCLQRESSGFWISALVGDAIIYVFTVYKCMKFKNLRLLESMMEDGSRYFVIICLTHMLNASLFFVEFARGFATL
ncbi:hypothetical protein M422DRAFT_40041 [Sphaerobolus stellatus SS14]|uniref:Uncharacterized protein n=1 Tax=Sphaerobolus stellatus (strain SS14) TaxID=990650 RepID=A0A0C9UAJ2_SPHS4|nr:hypothetical protein M422DRAFT_40041 [Sphaerobolus stellatus SS14]